MDHLRSHLPHLCDLVYWRLHTCEEASKEGTAITGISSCTSAPRAPSPMVCYHASSKLTSTQWLVSYGTRRKYGQPPQNHFTFYNQQRPYGQQQSQQPYVQRADGTYPEPPPLYNGDAPPSYYAPPVPKTNPEQSAGQYGMLPPQYGAAPQASGPSQYGAPAGYQEVPLGNYPTSAQQSGVAYPAPPQQSGVVAGSSSNDVEAQNHNQAQNPELPPRPQQAKLAISSFMSRFRK